MFSGLDSHGRRAVAHVRHTDVSTLMFQITIYSSGLCGTPPFYPPCCVGSVFSWAGSFRLTLRLGGRITCGDFPGNLKDPLRTKIPKTTLDYPPPRTTGLKLFPARFCARSTLSTSYKPFLVRISRLWLYSPAMGAPKARARKFECFGVKLTRFFTFSIPLLNFPARVARPPLN